MNDTFKRLGEGFAAVDKPEEMSWSQVIDTISRFCEREEQRLHDLNRQLTIADRANGALVRRVCELEEMLGISKNGSEPE